MRFEPISFIQLVERGYGVKLTRLDGCFLKILGASRLDDPARVALRQHKLAILPYLPGEESN